MAPDLSFFSIKHCSNFNLYSQYHINFGESNLETQVGILNSLVGYLDNMFPT